jgi:hypothetical protein
MFRPKTLRILSNAILVLAIIPVGGSAAAQEGSSFQARPFISWQTMTSHAMEALQHPREHEVNSLILEFAPNPAQPGRNFATLVDDLAFDDSLPKVGKKGQARKDVETLRANIAAILKEAKRKKMDTFLMESEISFPPGMLESYPEAADLNSGFVWHFLELRLEEVLQALPDAAGIVLYTEEPNDLNLYLMKNFDRRAAIKKLLEVYHSVCRRNGRRLIVTTFVDYDAERLQILLSALKQTPPAEDFLVDNYICPSDWGFISLLNPAIGNVGGHQEFLTFDYTGEVWGQGNIPLCEANLLRDRLQAARRKNANLVGINGYVSWYSQQIFGKPSEINLDLAPKLLHDPDQDPAMLVHGWLKQRYGEQAAGQLTPAFLKSFDVAQKAIQTLGFWVSEAPKSAFPDPVWIDFSTRTESLAVFDPSHKSLENQLTHPDNEILAKVIEEKDQAVTMANEGLRAVKKTRLFLRDADFQQLHGPFALALRVARAYRLYMEIYYRFRMWDESGRGPVPPPLSALLRSGRDLVREMKGAGNSPPVFCPSSFEVCLTKLEGYLKGEVFAAYPASVVFEHSVKYPPQESGCPAQH